MKFKKLFLMALTIPVLLASCKRDEQSKNDDGGDNTLNITDIDKLVVPSNFNFETTKDLLIRVKVANPSFPEERFGINIYIDEPSTGKLSIQGMTDEKHEFTAKMRVDATQEFIYIEKVDLSGNKTYEKVPANKFVSKLFDNGAEPNAYVFTKAGSGFTCNTGCATTYNNYNGNLVINSGVACITGTFTGKLTMNGGIVKFCASGNLDSLTLNNSSRIYILENTVLTIDKILSNSATSQLYNWSDSLKVNNCYDANNVTENHGRMYIFCSLNVTSTGSFGNFGRLFISNNLSVDNTFTNYSHVTVNNNVTVNAGKNLYNYCNLSTTNNLIVNGTLTSNSFTKVIGTTTLASGAKATLQNGALLSTANLTSTGEINGTGTNTSYVKVSATSTLNSGSTVKGKINYCDNNGVETNNATYTSPAQLSCSGYLATNSCNNEGFGVLVVPDADSDGVPDVLDGYPNDPTRAFNRFYPCATTCSNIVFEDLWPSKGDYDYNDLVVAFNVHKVYNAGNTVVDYKTKVKPRAVGAGFDNAFGFSLDNIYPNEVLNVTGQTFVRNYISRNPNGTEANQARAVIICFDSPEPYLHRQGGSMFNTIKANPFCASDTNFTSVTFATAIDDSRAVFEEFNPFIIVNRTRGLEVHMANHKPTSLADQTKFGTRDDRSVPANGVYYKNAQGLPWAMQIPENFAYPIEKASILQAYNYFDDWAMSGGTSYPNWYRNFGSYRNNSFIY